jgi:predicted ATPase
MGRTVASAFVGRSSEIARLEGLRAGVLVTLWGPGGVGKTRLAREHADRERRRGRVVAWADLAGAKTARETLAVIASSLGVVLGGTDDDIEALGRAACGQRAIVIADNLEQLDEASRAVVTRLARIVVAGGVAGGATLLATSRELLGAGSDVELEIALAPLSEEEGLALFDSLAGAGSVEAAPAVAQSIVKRLDALPLAIELAAARVPLLGMTELLARLDRKLDVLGTAKGNRPARHAPLRAAIAWSWDLLDDGEREALMACASFEAPFDAALAEAVIGGPEADALDRLERLRARALVHASPGSDASFQFMHAKVLVVDGSEAVISTGNYASFRMALERNFVVRDADPADVDVLMKLFDADFARKSPDLTCTRLLVSPVNAKQRLLDFIASAKTELLVESMQLADNDVRDALAARKAAGVVVRVLLADPGWITANADAATFLTAHGIEARHMKQPGVHVKAIVADNKVAYAGSENLSWTSLTKNREVGVLITEPTNISQMHATLTQDWLIATPF